VGIATRPRQWGAFLARGLLIGGLAGVAWASLLRPESLPGEVALVSDKVLHAVGYAVLGVLSIAAGIRPVVAGALLVAFGLLLEVAQLMSGYRTFEWTDLMADAAGAAVGIGVAVAVAVRRASARVTRE
jgi:VanZ family protein